MFKNLSQVLGALKKGYAYDPMSSLPIVDVYLNPAAASDTAVHAAVTLTTAVQNITTAITNPDFPRALTIKGNAAGIAGNVVIYGKDQQGHTLSETIALNGSSSVAGVVVFVSVTKITFPVKTNVAGDTVSIGISAKFGTSRPFAAATDLTLLEADGVAEAVSASSFANGTFTPTTAPNGTHDYTLFYKASII